MIISVVIIFTMLQKLLLPRLKILLLEPIWILTSYILKSNLKASNALVAGDSGNDSAMFDMEDIKGIVVANAHEELYKYTKYRQIYHAEKDCGDGVIEGLVYYGILPEEAIVSSNTDHTEDYIIQQELNSIASEDDKEKLDLILEGYEKAIIALKKNITPLGFSACSIETT